MERPKDDDAQNVSLVSGTVCLVTRTGRNRVQAVACRDVL